jgi:hypothetical protein
VLGRTLEPQNILRLSLADPILSHSHPLLFAILSYCDCAFSEVRSPRFAKARVRGCSARAWHYVSAARHGLERPPGRAA